MLSRAVLRRLVPLVAAGAALACAALPASAHVGPDDRPGAPRMDLEVLITPPVTGETSPGGQGPAVTVDTFGNVLATALKEEAQAVTVDQRAPAKVRAGSWRWQSGDDGRTFANVSGRPVQADNLVPGGGSVASATDERGRGYLLEAHNGVGVLTVTRSTEKDDVMAEAVHVVPGTGPLGATRIAAHGDGRVLLATPDPLGYSINRSSDAGASFAHTNLAIGDTDACDIATGRGKASSQALVACLKNDNAIIAFSSKDDFTTSTPHQVAAAAPGTSRGRPSVAVAPDGALSVLFADTKAGATTSALVLKRSRDRGRTWTTQNLAVERGLWAGASVSVNKRGRIGVGAYHRASSAVGWHVRLAVFDAGRAPIWSDFASHDPVTPKAWISPPDVATALAAGPDGLFHLLWTSVKVTPPADGGRQTSLIRNVWSVRTLST